VLELTGDLKLGDMIHILGYITDFDQQVTSMEIEHQKIQSAGAGMEIALKVVEMVRRGDVVYRYEGNQD
jgi:translation elongation factor EF-1alpha